MALQLDMHASFSIAHVVIDIVWIVYGERFRDNRICRLRLSFPTGKEGVCRLFIDPQQAFHKQVYKSKLCMACI